MRRLALVLAALAGLEFYSPPPQSPVDSGLRHIVVIYQENNSFDHYFGAYPHAENPPGEPPFTALPGTPPLDGLSLTLLQHNPNGVNPFRLDRTQINTIDQDHSYTQEQMAYDHGKMDLFPLDVGHAGPPPGGPPAAATNNLNLAYFDGNTVTALWNYAQRFAISDHTFQTTFGPSVLGAINLVSGQTNGVVAVRNGTSPNVIIDGGAGSYTVMGDADPVGDICDSSIRVQLGLGGPNIGNLLTAANVTWGWFQPGFDTSVVNPDNSTGCARSHKSLVGVNQKDYVPHHEPFQYYASTANPTHKRPTSVADIGHNVDAANHQYDLNDFYAAVSAGNLPSVSFIKPAGFENGHAGNSDPLDEQAFLVHVINFIQRSPDWKNTAIIVTWDDSDGWYDHLMGPVVNTSVGPEDVLNGQGICGDGKATLSGIDAANHHALGRCGYGPRIPLLAISPFARRNFVDSHVTDQTSILRLIEDTFLDGRRVGFGSFDTIAGPLDGLFDFAHPDPAPLLLDEKTGEPVSH